MSTIRVKLIGFSAAQMAIINAGADLAGKDRLCTVKCFIGNGKRSRYELRLLAPDMANAVHRNGKPTDILDIARMTSQDATQAARKKIVRLIDLRGARD